jgi:N-acetylglucosamine repressor
MNTSNDRLPSRSITSQMVLRAIYDRGPLSRADLARLTGLTAPTISEITGALILDGLVEEIGLGPSTGGKRPTLLRMVDDARHLIGLDLARGDFRGAVMNLRGEIRQRISLPLEDRKGTAALQLAYQLVERLVASTNRPVLGIGIGAPGLVDAGRGVVINAVNVDWHDLPLADLLSQRTGMPVYATNDCHTAALAEHLFGGGQESEALVVVNVGYGVGAGIVIKGQLLPGNPFGAGEIGHLVVEPGAELCSCGNRGCLETVASTRGILRRARQRGIEIDPIEDADMLEGMQVIDRLQTLCQQGDAAALDVVRQTGCYLGRAAASLVGVLGCCRILFAGSIVCFGDPLLDAVRAEMAAWAFSAVARQTEVGYVSVGADIVLRGTSVLVLSHEMRLL